jgi:hypothetical protein
MFNRHPTFFLITILTTFLFLVHVSYGKEFIYDSCWVICGGSGKNVEYVYCCEDWPSGCTLIGNCGIRYDPPFPFIKYESSATNYPTKNYVAVFLLSILTFSFAVLLISKNRFFIWKMKIMSKFFQIKPQIIQTKCKYYSSYWFRKFKNYL